MAAFFDGMLHDLRYAARSLASDRIYSLLSLLCLSLAIGTNTTVFTFVNALLLRPLPLAAPDRLVSVHETRVADPEAFNRVSYPNFMDWTKHGSDVAEFAAERPVTFRLSDGGVPNHIRVSSAPFTALTVPIRPARSRASTASSATRSARTSARISSCRR